MMQKNDECRARAVVRRHASLQFLLAFFTWMFVIFSAYASPTAVSRQSRIPEEKGFSQAIVLGNYPEYLAYADTLGAKKFFIPEARWRQMNDKERWLANKKFLDDAIMNGDAIFLATRIREKRPDEYFQRELNYLFKKGYHLSKNGSRLIQ